MGKRVIRRTMTQKAIVACRQNQLRETVCARRGLEPAEMRTLYVAPIYKFCPFVRQKFAVSELIQNETIQYLQVGLAPVNPMTKKTRLRFMRIGVNQNSDKWFCASFFWAEEISCGFPLHREKGMTSFQKPSLPFYSLGR